MKKLIPFAFIMSVVFQLTVQPITAIAAEDNLTEAQIKAERAKYSQPVSVISRNTGMTLNSGCMADGSDYTPMVPDTKNLDAGTVTSVKYFSPNNLGYNWFIFDHIGEKDSAFGGARHIARRDSGGIQWFGYDSTPYNDFMLRDFTNDIDSSGSFTINVKQSPVRADWHTINGSGVMFGVNFSNSPSLAGLQNDVYEDGYSSDSTYTSTFSGYAFVSTRNYNELRYYYDTDVNDFMNGTASYYVILQENKICNSQSITVKYDGSTNTIKLFIGRKEWGSSKSALTIGENYEVGEVTNGVSAANTSIDELPNVTLALPPLGSWSGTMVDYAEHNCSSLSSVYMFNYTFNEKEYF